PTFGPLTARIAAFFMTITPIVVADSRTNNMDATLVFFLLLAGWVLQRAVRKRRGWLVLVSFALVGVAFNIKMLQAYMVLPAMYLYYWVASRQNWKRVLTQTVLATLALAVVSLSWPLIHGLRDHRLPSVLLCLGLLSVVKFGYFDFDRGCVGHDNLDPS
ncbi:glycosyltransferase family 39 protein, partial [Limosilactobacillus fermentum]|uniref:glycosyltransferase family 39 protein n=1 Tax=Limosilactobacillus fermentum TaxID=1613 RepID=UPI003EBF9319